MKKLMMSVAAMMLSAGAALADPVEGLWRTQPDDGAWATVRMSSCGSKICGVVAQAYDMQGNVIQSDTVGSRIVWDMVPQGDGTYSDGKIRQPSTGKVYNSKMELNGSRLEVSGCIAFLCKSQVWQR